MKSTTWYWIGGVLAVGAIAIVLVRRRATPDFTIDLPEVPKPSGNGYDGSGINPPVTKPYIPITQPGETPVTKTKKPVETQLPLVDLAPDVERPNLTGFNLLTS